MNVCNAVVTYGSPVAADNCGVSVVTLTTLSASNGSVFGLGVTNVSYGVNDTSSNAGSCTFSVTVVDREAPRLSE